MTLREALAWGLRRRARLRIHGDSMAPLLADGDEVLYQPGALLRVGDLVVARHPFKRGTTLVKQLIALDPRGHHDLRGLNPRHSTDSRSFGAVPPRLILGRITCRLPSESR